MFGPSKDRTSCKCSKCNGGKCGKCGKFMVRENPKPFRDNIRLVHGLLSRKNCANVWNRDYNGAKNIYKIACNCIHRIEKPSYLCRRMDCKIQTQMERSE